MFADSTTQAGGCATAESLEGLNFGLIRGMLDTNGEQTGGKGRPLDEQALLQEWGENLRNSPHLCGHRELQKHQILLNSKLRLKAAPVS